MKAHSLTIYSLAAVLAFSYFSSKTPVQSKAVRAPSSIIEFHVKINDTKKDQVKPQPKKKVAVNNKEVKALKAKMAKLEAELAEKNKKDSEVAVLKKEIADLSLAIKESKEAKAKENSELQTSLCLAKRSESQLEEKLKLQLKDKEDILKEFEALKAEIKAPKKEVVAEVAPAPAPVQNPNADIVALMAQMTSMM